MRRKPVRRAGVALTLRRRPRLRDGLVVAIALLCGARRGDAPCRRPSDARAAWGRSTTVLVATRGPRRPATCSTPATRGWWPTPPPLVPAGALTPLPDDGRVAAPVYDGEVVREERLAPAGASALAARLPAGHAGDGDPRRARHHAPGRRRRSRRGARGAGPGGGRRRAARASRWPRTCPWSTSPTPPSRSPSTDDVAPRLAVAFGQGAVTLALVGASGRRTATQHEDAEAHAVDHERHERVRLDQLAACPTRPATP